MCKPGWGTWRGARLLQRQIGVVLNTALRDVAGLKCKKPVNYMVHTFKI